MKFIVSSHCLRNTLRQFKKVVTTKSLPILEFVHLEVNEQVLTITGTDLDVWLQIKIPVDSRGERCGTCVELVVLLTYLEYLPEQPLVITMSEKEMLIVGDNEKLTLGCTEEKDFPKFQPPSKDTPNTAINSSLLADLIKGVKEFTSTDKLRPAMTGILLESDEDGIQTVATNELKLSVRSVPEKLQSKFRVIMSKKFTELTTAIFKNEEVKIIFEPTRTCIACNDIILIGRNIDARYPDYKAVIPKNRENKIEIGRQHLIRKLEGISRLAGGVLREVVVTVKGISWTMEYSNESQSVQGKTELGCIKHNGSDVAVSVNSLYLLAVLKTHTTEAVEFDIGGDRDVILVKGVGTGVKDINELSLLMPITK